MSTHEHLLANAIEAVEEMYNNIKEMDEFYDTATRQDIYDGLEELQDLIQNMLVELD